MDRKTSIILSGLIILVMALGLLYLNNPTVNLDFMGIGQEKSSQISKAFGSEKKIINTPYSKTVCENYVCNYYQIRQVFEDDEWKRFEDARSLKNEVEVIYLENDSNFTVELVDFYYVDGVPQITVLQSSKIKDKDIPTRIWKLNKSSMTNIEIKELKDEYKLKFEKVKEENSTFAESIEMTYTNFTFGDILEFGFNSTTIILQDAGTENLADCDIYETPAQANNNFNVDSGFIGEATGSGTAERYSLYKFNISEVPQTATIDEAKLYVYFFADNSGGAEGGISSHQIYKDFQETFPTWNRFGTPNSTTWNNTPMDNITQFVGAGFKSFNVLPEVKNKRADNKVNATILLRGASSITNGFNENYYKETGTPSERPYLNVTYSLGAVVTLNFPDNLSNFSTTNVTFNCSSAGTDLLNISLVIDDSIRYTLENSTAGETYLEIYQNILGLGSGLHNWTCVSSNSVFQGVTESRIVNITAMPPVVSMLGIPNFNYTKVLPVSLGCASNDTDGVMNLTLYVDGSLNQTVYNTTALQNLTIFESYNFLDGVHNFSCKSSDSQSLQTIHAGRTFYVDTVKPVIKNVTNLLNQTTYSLPQNLTWSFTAKDNNLDSCYFNWTDNSTYTIVTCNSNITTQFNTGGNKTFYMCANDSASNENCTSRQISMLSIILEQYPESYYVTEGQKVTFYITLNMSRTIPTTGYSLFFDGVEYSSTTTNQVSSRYQITSYEITIPVGYGNSTGKNYTWYWWYNISGYSPQITTNQSIAVFSLSIDDCSANTEQILNLTLKDEKLNSVMSLVNRSTLIEVDINISSRDTPSVSQTYANSWVNDTEALVCVNDFILNNSDYRIDWVFEFEGTDYVHEFHYMDNGTLDNSTMFNSLTTKTISLMDLLATDSTTCIGSYFNVDGLSEDDIIIHTFRKYTGVGEFFEVERSKEDDVGNTHIHLVEEDVIYYFVVSQGSKPLYTSGTYNAKVTGTLCQILLEAQGDYDQFSTDWDLMTDGTYTLRSSGSTREAILTFTASSPKQMNLTVYKYNHDGTYTSIGSSQTLATSGTLTVPIPPVAGNISFFAVATQGDNHLKSIWIDLESKARDHMDTKLVLFLAFMILVVFALLGVSEGAIQIPIFIVGMVIVAGLGLLELPQNVAGYSLIMYLICSGGLITWKLARSKRQ